MPQALTQFDKNAVEIKKTILANDNKVPTAADLETKKELNLMGPDKIQANMLTDMKESVRKMDALRKGSKDARPVDLSLQQFMQSVYGIGTTDGLYLALGLNPSMHSVEQLMNMTDFTEGYRWLIPEVIREAVRLGLRRNPIYPDLIAGEESVTQMQVNMPYIQKSASTMRKIGESETIPVGALSFIQKIVKIHKIGTGLKMSDEVMRYVSINVLSLYLQDAGVQLGLGMDAMAIDTLINGDDSDDLTNSAPVVGVENTTNGITYFDMLRVWMRMGRLGRMPSGLLSNENTALKIMQFDEFKGANYNNKKQDINIKTPIPQTQDYYVNGSMPTGPILGFIDKNSALMKLNATGLLVESERIAERQLEGTYITQTTGFAKLFNDAFVLLDGSQAFSSQGFPASMNVDKAEQVTIS